MNKCFCGGDIQIDKTRILLSFPSKYKCMCKSCGNVSYISVDDVNKMNPAWLLENVRVEKKVDDVDNTKLVKVLEKIYHKLNITNSIELTPDEVDEYVENDLRKRGFKLSYHYFYGNRSVKVSW
jgi:hypothetical protein